MKTVVQILKDARALIADEKSWTKEYYARDEDGNAVHPKMSHATCFCSLGAISRVTGRPVSHVLPDELASVFALDAEFADRGVVSVEGSIVDFNDDHTHAEVLALFDRAIDRAESAAVQ